MSSKKSAAARPVAEPGPLPALAGDLPRHQLALGTRSACALFRGFEAIRSVQQRAAHHALARHQAAAERLRQPCNPADLLMVQTELLRFDMDEAARYWQQLGQAALEMQQMLLESMAAALREESQEAVGTLQAMAAAMPQPSGGNGHAGHRAA